MPRGSLAELRSTASAGGHHDGRPPRIGRKRATTISGDAARLPLSHATGRLDDTGTFANAIGYLRVSTEEQADSGLGLDAQRASITDAAARCGLPLRAMVVDDGVCGGLPIDRRPALFQAVQTLRRGDVVLVARRDRLGRDVIEVGLIEREIAKRGARVISAAGEGSDGDDPDSLFMRRMADVFAERERLMIKGRTKAALNVKRAMGERVGTLPFGFQIAATDPAQQKLEPAPVEQRILAQIRMLRASGLSARQIAADLNAHGWRTRRETPWRFQYVARALRKVG